MILRTTKAIPECTSVNNVKTEVKYQYALDDSLKVIDIGSERIISGNNYLCLSCGKHLRPVLGEIRQKHFRHKVHIDCSSETYLHNLAKRMFFQTYSNCLENNQPYILEHQAPKRCTACKEHGPCQVGYESVQTDLTRYYKEISIEARDGEFIPDILLRNGSKPLYIEIAVTHFIEERKESSGTRIVEITINNETDIDLIKSCVISENDYRVSTSNFNPAPIVGNFADDCQKTINCFVLHLNGKSVIGPVNARKYRQLIDAGIYVEKISGNGPATYINKVVELYLKGMKIKNCWLCAFHCLHYQYVESFCKLLKITLNNTNRAVECKSFKLKKIIPECDLIKDATDRVMNSREEKPARKQPPRTQQNNQNQVITYTDVRIKTAAIDFFDKILNNKNTYIPTVMSG